MANSVAGLGFGVKSKDKRSQGLGYDKACSCHEYTHEVYLTLHVVLWDRWGAIFEKHLSIRGRA